MQAIPKFYNIVNLPLYIFHSIYCNSLIFISLKGQSLIAVYDSLRRINSINQALKRYSRTKHRFVFELFIIIYSSFP